MEKHFGRWVYEAVPCSTLAVHLVQRVGCDFPSTGSAHVRAGNPPSPRQARAPPPRPQGREASHSQTAPSPLSLDAICTTHRGLWQGCVRLFSRGRNSQLAQPIPRLQRFRSVRITLDHMPQLGDAIVLLAEFNQSESLLQLRRRGFASARKVLQYLVIALGRLLV